MTLEEKLKEIDKDQLVNIGSESGFFYIGPAGDYLDGIAAKTDVEIEREFEHSVVKNLSRLKETKKKIITAEQAQKDTQVDLEVKQQEAEEIRRKLVEAEAAYQNAKDAAMKAETYLKECEERKRKLESALESSEKRLENYSPTLDREVQIVYPNIDKRFTSIIVEGQEHGPYWSYKEYLEKNGSEELYEKETQREEANKLAAMRKKEGRYPKGTCDMPYHNTKL